MDSRLGSSNDSVMAEDLDKAKREGSLDFDPLLSGDGVFERRFVGGGGRGGGKRRRGLNLHPLLAAVILLGSCLGTLVLGFVLGRVGLPKSDVMSTPVVNDLYAWMKSTADKFPVAQTEPTPVPAATATSLPGTMTPEDLTIFDILRLLPPVDLYQEYGIKHNELSLYPKPLKSQICLVNADTRKWSPEEHKKDLNSMDVLHWGYLNHYTYAQIHGYTFKHIQAPKQPGLHSTWVKIKELYRMTLRPECRFTIMLDGDTVFQDLRVPMEALLSHWNITSDITLAGGVDIDRSVDDRGRLQLNTGFVVTQKTPVLDSLMLDWIDCPTDVKYRNCSKWKENWSHEQAALSNYIRYDPEYRSSIRELPVEEVHLGGFIKHYWDREKPKLVRASKDAILNRFLPGIYRELLGDWNRIHERPTLRMYGAMMRGHRPEKAKGGSVRRG